jgi:hypothetical protein
MMEEAAKILNIKKHIVGMKSQQVELAAPTDIEGHIGSDGRLYVLDTARVCPPVRFDWRCLLLLFDA